MATNENNHVALWAKSAANAGYFVSGENVPHIGVSGDSGPGFIVPLPAPAWFNSIADEPTRDNVFRAMAAHALRVGQAKLKASDAPTRDIAAEGAASALNGGYKPSRERSNDIVDSATAKMFADHVRARVLAVKSDATESQIESTIAAQAETDAGKALLAKMRGEVVANGTYVVSRKGKGTTGAVAGVTL